MVSQSLFIILVFITYYLIIIHFHNSKIILNKITNILPQYTINRHFYKYSEFKSVYQIEIFITLSEFLKLYKIVLVIS